ncbi:Threonine--tRNA ligase 1-cytoplasmic [Plutella xylostella]|uniref:threonine--tRNA ligase n=1 Tax=Plutella xylostella TaxID=51655 RepID=A0ABQ7Q7Q1_PLUXY|nr:Threonine--tRNA ligase 1-cytoplasmic [Plutella xylostella]
MGDTAVEDIQKLNIDEKSQKKAMKEKKKTENSGGGKVGELNPPPEYIQRRIELWDKYKAQYLEDLEKKPAVSIVVTLPDGKQVEASAWRTTPYDVAKGISQGLADNSIISKVNGVLWDLDRPLEGDCKLELLRFDNPEAQAVFWHSSAHMLGEAMERVYGGCLCYGPPIEEGFYYDMHYPEKGISSTDFPAMETLVKKIAKEKQPFERLELTKEQLLEMFDYNLFKVRILNEKVDTPTTTVYRCGTLIDLCRGPHVRHTGKVKAFKVTKNSSTYWEGKADAETLQRVYGVSFPEPKQLKEWELIQAEAAKRDHRKIGKEQELFFFHELSPGSCFFQPRGAHIYNTLVSLIREQYRVRGFQEVVTPNIYNAKLWQTSGHWAHYADNMFSFEIEKETFALKPMNCPGHCLMFDVRSRSWRELPLRMADFGVLHRNELSGALSGLTRVRRFQQDDAHIFCTPQQIEPEVVRTVVQLELSGALSGLTRVRRFQQDDAHIFCTPQQIEPEVLELSGALSGLTRVRRFQQDDAHIFCTPQQIEPEVLELSGALSGLTRVRRFQQDDAHIFCTPQQIEPEVHGCLEFLDFINSTFGFTYQLNLSTRPEKYLGDLETWEHAEKALADSLNKFGKPWQVNPGDGAFYGPKIDIIIKDALRRSFQCATVQLDFQQPERFNLTYVR